MEVLGTYDPKPKKPLANNDDVDSNANIPSASSPPTTTYRPPKPKQYKNIELDQQRAAYWLGVGAQPSESVEKMFVMVRFFCICTRGFI